MMESERQLDVELAQAERGGRGDIRLAYPLGEADPAFDPAVLARKAYRILHMGFVTLALVAGLDKFFYILTDWSAYLASVFPQSLGLSYQGFMLGVGVLEIVLALGLALSPKVFADVFALWLGAITVNLVIQGEHFDIALFNFALAAGACALARVSPAGEDPISVKQTTRGKNENRNPSPENRG